MHLIRLTGALLALCLIPSLASAASDEMDGKVLFENNCSACHGIDGKPTKFGKTLKPFPARNHQAIASVVSRDELRRIIAYGINGTAMTPKKYDLDSLQIEAVIDYIKTFEYKPNLANGKKRFEAVCSSCHGMDGRAATGMGAKNLVYSELDLAGITHTMRYGRPGTKMTSKRHQMTNEGIADVANYVHSLRFKADAVKGAKAYKQNCIACHKTPADIKLRGNAASKRTIADLSNRLLDLRIRHGRHVDRAGKHVAHLPASDVDDIIAYMRKSTK
ncbi:cbb3-type cytochrome c oxidase subunit CcoP2 [Mariprofundus micogutta]|uniref:Cbb3-type cytochrome c oxidase subunit CcoP2 n=1 Tax=Mariprofundus micogutta TaxID=1921010 RepID=A0A1L8CQE9_9PROT|nr:c-type cytochrome [Mariprofundus micogutta]GAV21117.1 cbb3-type cytochrome c oxidase subunit CcoP2 [Mariprofundus micogutta]